MTGGQGYICKFVKRKSCDLYFTVGPPTNGHCWGLKMCQPSRDVCLCIYLGPWLSALRRCQPTEGGLIVLAGFDCKRPLLVQVHIVHNISTCTYNFTHGRGGGVYGVDRLMLLFLRGCSSFEVACILTFFFYYYFFEAQKQRKGTI